MEIRSEVKRGRSGLRLVPLLSVCLAIFGCAWGKDSHDRTAAGNPCASSRLFAPGSVWNACLASDASTDSASERMVDGLVDEVRNEQEQGTGPYIQTTSYSTPLYVVGRSLGVSRVTLDHPRQSWRRGLQRAFRKVPIPSGARPAGGSDAHMTVWQPSRDRLWELWRARKTASGWHASWGGAMKRVSKSAGYFDSRSWPGLSAPSWGATATSLPVIAGTILIKELRAGQINHALALSLPAPRADSFAWPAQRTDGTGPRDAIPEGARLRLDPDLDLESLHLPPITLMIARAAQSHGMIVRDQTGVAIGLYAQDPGRRKDPYDGSRGFFAGQSPTQLLSRFPWDRLEVMHMRLCSRGSRGCPGP